MEQDGGKKKVKRKRPAVHKKPGPKRTKNASTRVRPRRVTSRREQRRENRKVDRKRRSLRGPPPPRTYGNSGTSFASKLNDVLSLSTLFKQPEPPKEKTKKEPKVTPREVAERLFRTTDGTLKHFYEAMSAVDKVAEESLKRTNKMEDMVKVWEHQLREPGLTPALQLRLQDSINDMKIDIQTEEDTRARLIINEFFNRAKTAPDIRAVIDDETAAQVAQLETELKETEQRVRRAFDDRAAMAEDYEHQRLQQEAKYEEERRRTRDEYNRLVAAAQQIADARKNAFDQAEERLKAQYHNLEATAAMREDASEEEKKKMDERLGALQAEVETTKRELIIAQERLAQANARGRDVEAKLTDANARGAALTQAATAQTTSLADQVRALKDEVKAMADQRQADAERQMAVYRDFMKEMLARQQPAPPPPVPEQGRVEEPTGDGPAGPTDESKKRSRYSALPAPPDALMNTGEGGPPAGPLVPGPPALLGQARVEGSAGPLTVTAMMGTVPGAAPESSTSEPVTPAVVSETLTSEGEYDREQGAPKTARTDDEEKKGQGQSGEGDGTTDQQLEQKMRPYEHRGFSGVIASDQIKDLKDYTKRGNEMSFIMNLDNHKQPGSHWVPVYIRWGNTKSGGPEVDYADSFGDPPSKSTVSQLKELVKSRGAPYMLKMKINRLKEQRENSDTCGGHSMRFLADMYAGKTFKDATGYTVERAEHLAKKMEGRGGVPRFGYI